MPMKMFEIPASNVKAFDINPMLFRNYQAWKKEAESIVIVARDVVGEVLLVWYRRPS